MFALVADEVPIPPAIRRITESEDRHLAWHFFRPSRGSRELKAH